MTSYVLIDAGLAFKLITPNPQRDHIKQLVVQWMRSDFTLCAPTLWHYEITSILTKMVRFGHMDEDVARDSLTMTLKLGVHLVVPDEDQARHAFEWTRRLGRAAAYDSFYLAIAESLGCDFWTVDRRLVNAVNLPWVKLAATD